MSSLTPYRGFRSVFASPGTMGHACCVAAVICCATSGCRPKEPRPGEIPRGAVPRPAAIRLIDPKDKQVFAVGQRIHFRAEVTVPEGVRPPAFVLTQFLRGKVLSGGATINLKEPGGPSAGTYEYEGMLRGQTFPGSYTFYAEVLLFQMRPPLAGEKGPGSNQYGARTPEIHVSVRRR